MKSHEKHSGEEGRDGREWNRCKTTSASSDGKYLEIKYKIPKLIEEKIESLLNKLRLQNELKVYQLWLGDVFA